MSIQQIDDLKKEAYTSFSSWIDHEGEPSFSQKREVVVEAFDRSFVRADGLNLEAFSRRLSELQVSESAILTINRVAQTCIAHPHIHQFFEETDIRIQATTSPRVDKWGGEEKSTILKIQRAFSITLMIGGPFGEILEVILIEMIDGHISQKTSEYLVDLARKSYQPSNSVSSCHQDQASGAASTISLIRPAPEAAREPSQWKPAHFPISEAAKSTSLRQPDYLPALVDSIFDSRRREKLASERQNLQKFLADEHKPALRAYSPLAYDLLFAGTDSATPIDPPKNHPESFSSKLREYATRFQYLLPKDILRRFACHQEGSFRDAPTTALDLEVTLHLVNDLIRTLRQRGVEEVVKDLRKVADCLEARLTEMQQDESKVCGPSESATSSDPQNNQSFSSKLREYATALQGVLPPDILRHIICLQEGYSRDAHTYTLKLEAALDIVEDFKRHLHQTDNFEVAKTVGKLTDCLRARLAKIQEYAPPSKPPQVVPTEAVIDPPDAIAAAAPVSHKLRFAIPTAFFTNFKKTLSKLENSESTKKATEFLAKLEQKNSFPSADSEISELNCFLDNIRDLFRIDPEHELVSLIKRALTELSDDFI